VVKNIKEVFNLILKTKKTRKYHRCK